jgi:hypothetical protein
MSTDTFTCCSTPMPWPTKTEDRTCPDCGTVWEREPVDLGAGARIKAAAAGDHEFARPGQVAPDLPPHDACMRCGRTELWHHYPAATVLEGEARTLAQALRTWTSRDEAKAQPGVRGSATTAVGAIDGMLRQLYQLRQQLVGEMRRFDDATVSRVDAMLAALRAGREAGK